MSMPQAFHIDEDELIQYALGTLKDAQLTMLTAHLSMCTECRAKLGAIQVELAAYAVAQPEEGALPEGARQRFLAKLSAPAVQESRLEQSREQRRTGALTMRLKERFGSPILPWALSGALAAAVLFLVYDDTTTTHENHQMVASSRRLVNEVTEYQELKEFLSGNNTQQVTLHQTALTSEPPQGHVTYSPISGKLVFSAANMPALPAGKAYELWLLPASGDPPIPAGTFVPNLAGNGAILLPKLPERVSAKGFGITVEDAKGSAKPTTPILLSGE